MKILLWVLVGFLLCGAAPPSAQANEKLVLSTGTRDPFTTTDRQGFLDLLIKEVFRRIDIDAEIIVYQASARALKNANEGIEDGVSLRVKGIEKNFPNLVRVPEKIMDNDFVAYSIHDYLGIKDWASVSSHDIAYILGWQIFQNNLPDHKSTVRAKDAGQLMELLTHDRVDLILYERWQGLWRAKQLNLKLKVYEPPLAKREMFMYLHKKHAHLIDRVAASLAEMKQDGTYQKIFDQTLTHYLQ